MLKQALKGAVLASAVASLFAASSAHAKQAGHDKGQTKTVKCAGVNSCKGKGACAGADNSCKGKNECKGKGWQEAKSDKECKDKGGTVVTAAK